MVKKKTTNISTKVQLYIATGIVLLLVAFASVVGWLDASMETKTSGTGSTVALSDVTLKGESTCLEHVGTGSHTMECAMGIKTASGAVYAIKGEATPAADNSLEVTGILTPASSDEVYKIDGTLTVK
ncbi:MAG: hypothetical protein JWM00_188 [Candidatus Saccharibacteria bacterium]|nr:hypothetical protein [Candidatus Saccharibacteria bacterium]